MRRGFCVLATVGLVALMTTACSPARRTVTIAPVGQKNLVFNPEWTGLPTFDVLRSDWPSTVAYSEGDQHTHFEVRIVDRTGGGWHHGRNGYYYRRFSSVRHGWREP